MKLRYAINFNFFVKNRLFSSFKYCYMSVNEE